MVISSDPLPRFANVEPSPVVANRMLELFAPTRQARRQPLPPPDRDRPAVWRADAVHRAKNMAQMAASLANLADHASAASRSWLPQTVTLHARALARTYDELAADGGSSVPVPCTALLAEVATRLSAIFGIARIDWRIPADRELALTPDRRRALILIASELIINAMKYAFVPGVAGSIAIALGNDRGLTELIVEDDGVGLADPNAAGQGSALVRDLCAILGGTVDRTTGARGGLSVAVRFAVAG